MVLKYDGHVPAIDETVFVAPNASVIGDVSIGAGSSIWFGAVLRGDEISIRIGQNSNIQDGVIMHGDEGGQTVVGDNVTVGHGAILHGCTIENGALVGMGAVVLDGVYVESGALIAAGAVVSPGKRVEANSLWAGCPARKLKDLEPSTNKEAMLDSAHHYVKQAGRYRCDDAVKYTDRLPQSASHK